MNKTIQTKAGTLTILDEWKGEKGIIRSSVLCFCGKKFECELGKIKNGNTSSCGCFKKKYNSVSKFKHGHGGIRVNSKQIPTPTYIVWARNRTKCNKAEHLLEKAIKFCKEWDSFENFLNDMGEKPLNHKLSRIDKSYGFEPDNCEWVPIKTRIKK